MRNIVLSYIILLLTLGNNAQAQDTIKGYQYRLTYNTHVAARDVKKQFILEQRIENIAENNEDEDIDYTTLFDQLSLYYEHPINLNRKDISYDLKQLRLLDDFQINAIINHIKKHGKLKQISPNLQKFWKKVKPGDPLSKAHPKGHYFNMSVVNPNIPARTVTATQGLMKWDEPRYLSAGEVLRIQSFPEDYNFLKSDPCYVMGMSVPPFMTQRVALEIAEKWLIPEASNGS